jgi:hypothetical protein
MEPETSLHCTSCGLPSSGMTCSVCGGSSKAIPLADGDAASSSAYASMSTRPELELAASAWQAGDHGRMVAHCLSTLGIRDPQPESDIDGPAFKASFEEQTLFVRIRGDQGLLVIEVPVARFPRTQYVPALRLALELSDRDGERSRFSARGDLVMCRTVLRLAVLTPVIACDAIRSTVAAAVEAARVFVGALQARALTPRDHRGFSLDSLPRGLDLEGGVRSGSSTGRATPVYAEPVADLGDVAADESGIPAALMPPSRAFSVAALRRPPAAGRVTEPPGAGLVTKASAVPPAAPAKPAVPPRARSEVASPSAAVPSSSPATVPQAQPATAGRPALQPPTTQSAAVVDPMGDTFVGHVSAQPQRTGGPEDPLCDLLHHAQALGAALSFADLPATMLLLVRATVYRAVYEFGATLPGPVAHLHEQTAELIREIHITAPGKRRGAMAIPSASPAFEVMNRMVTSRCQLGVGKTLHVQPITTSQDAKQHLARFVSEIGVAPDDLELRYFLAMGALCELLSRTKLPAPTQDKLRGLIAHAKSEGPTRPTVELLLTALSRMMA